MDKGNVIERKRYDALSNAMRSARFVGKYIEAGGKLGFGTGLFGGLQSGMMIVNDSVITPNAYQQKEWQVPSPTWSARKGHTLLPRVLYVDYIFGGDNLDLSADRQGYVVQLSTRNLANNDFLSPFTFSCMRYILTMPTASAAGATRVIDPNRHDLVPGGGFILAVDSIFMGAEGNNMTAGDNFGARIQYDWVEVTDEEYIQLAMSQF